MATQPRTEGERWARDELSLLLADRFSPAAVVRFLRHSEQRSARIRRERPRLARTAYGWLGLGAVAWGGLAVVGVEPFRRGRRDALAWWALTALMLDWHLGMFETADGRPRELSSADALTLARAWLVPVAAHAPTPLVVAAAAASDVLDGAAARRLAEPTRAGRDLEGLVDACFAAAALRGLRRTGRIGRAPAVGEGVRLGAGLAYALAHYFGRAQAPDATVVRAARATTATRVTGLLAAGTGHRATADALLAGGSALSVALVVRAMRTAPTRA